MFFPLIKKSAVDDRWCGTALGIIDWFARALLLYFGIVWVAVNVGFYSYADFSREKIEFSVHCENGWFTSEKGIRNIRLAKRMILKSMCFRISMCLFPMVKFENWSFNVFLYLNWTIWTFMKSNYVFIPNASLRNERVHYSGSLRIAI